VFYGPLKVIFKVDIFNGFVIIETIVDDRTINEYGAAGGIKIDRRNRSTRGKPTPDALCPP
jgi:hypothetical protein